MRQCRCFCYALNYLEGMGSVVFNEKRGMGKDLHSSTSCSAAISRQSWVFMQSLVGIMKVMNQALSLALLALSGYILDESAGF